MQLALRRFMLHDSEDHYHAAAVDIEIEPARRDYDTGFLEIVDRDAYKHDPRWPAKCEACEYLFTETDNWVVNQSVIYVSAEGLLWTQQNLPAGAMYDATWMPDNWKGADGISLTVMLPTSPPATWAVDAEASNCTRKGELHKCWIRHGDPRTQSVTVDKNGDTCQAGAGSIAVDGYHGFLQNGILTDS